MYLKTLKQTRLHSFFILLSRNHMVLEPSKMTASKASGSSSSKSPKVIKSIIHIKNVKFVTLEKDNFVSWKAHLEVIVLGNDLLVYVEHKVKTTGLAYQGLDFLCSFSQHTPSSSYS